MYAENICIMVLSHAALQELIYISIHISYHVLYFNMDSQVLNYGDNVKYLRFTFNSN